MNIHAQTELIKKRRTIRKALDLVRHDKRHIVSRGRFLDVLAGRAKISDGILRLAETLLRLNQQ